MNPLGVSMVVTGVVIIVGVIVANPGFFKNWVNRKAKINVLEDAIANRDDLLKQQAVMYGELMKEAQTLKENNVEHVKKEIALLAKISVQEKIIDEFGAFAESVKKYKLAN